MEIQINRKIDDIIPLLRRVWGDRRRILRNCGIALVVGVIIGFCIPKEYESTVVLAPEYPAGNSFTGMSSLASFAGINMHEMQGSDALYPELYPQIIESTIFLTDLYNMQVSSSDGEINTTLYDYIAKKQRIPWWEHILFIPLKIKAMLTPKRTMVVGDDSEKVTYYYYSEQQFSVINKLRKMLWTSVDVGNNVITINVVMQDAKIAAQVADKVAFMLQEYVTNYRTKKAQQDYIYSEKLLADAEKNYHEKQAEYAKYMDSHMLGTLKMKYKAEEERLMNEAQLAFNIYNQLAQQNEMTKAKVQENTPVYTVMQPAVIPQLPVAPRKMFIVAGFIFITFFGHIIWVVLASKFKNTLKKIAKG
jgi:uncharacterized protein involved in exopolysaccharide biosynthesis